VQEIAEWLDKLGMSEYAQRFAESRIDASVLPDLTDQDLKDLGIVLGDRSKMLRAIANLDNAPPTAAAASAQPMAVKTAMPAPEATGDRTAAAPGVVRPAADYGGADCPPRVL
jgi:SAM domain (Sterile alpha motif)